jgi:hypothetical protein
MANTEKSSSFQQRFVIAIALLQIVIACGLVGYTLYMQQSFHQLLKWEEMANVRALMRNSAETIDTQRDTIDRLGSHAPEYGEALAQCAKALEGVVPTFNAMQKLLSVDPSAIPLVGQMLANKIDQIEKINQGLAEGLPIIARDLYYTSEVLGDWDDVHNARLIAALDGIVLSLRVSADMLEEQWQSYNNITNAISAIGYLVAIAIALNAIAHLLNLRASPRGDDSPAGV